MFCDINDFLNEEAQQPVQMRGGNGMFNGGETSRMSFHNEFQPQQFEMVEFVVKSEFEGQKSRVDGLEERANAIELQLAGHPIVQAVIDQKLEDLKNKNDEQDRKIEELERQRAEDKRRLDELVAIVASLKLNGPGRCLPAPALVPVAPVTTTAEDKALELARKYMFLEGKAPLKKSLIENGRKYMISILNAYHPRYDDQKAMINLSFNLLEKMTINEI